MRYLKTFEGLHEFTDTNGLAGRCHLQVYRANGKPMLAIASEMADNPGQSVTNGAEAIATSILRRFGPVEEGLRFIERYPKDGEEWYAQERFAETRFALEDEEGELWSPTWQHITKEQVLAIVEEGESC